VIAPRNWKKFKRHPLSEKYADITGPIWEDLCRNLRKNGILGKRKVVLHEGMVLDGWQLFRACLFLNIKPEFEVLQLKHGMTAEEFIDTANDFRRHETPEQQQQRAQERRERVLAARQEGKSLRKIAEAEGVSTVQIQRDLADFADGRDDEPEGENQRLDDSEIGAPGGALLGGQEAGAELDGNTCRETESDAEQAKIPDKLKCIFEHISMMEGAVRLAEKLANLFQLVEATPAYRRYVDGKPHKVYSTYIRMAGRTIADIVPRLCPECKGIESSADSDPCPCGTCSGKGFLFAEEVKP
jgi:hypothetical protein